MKVLSFGATGNLGSRLLPALLGHNHTVVCYVRSPQKLKEILPVLLLEKIDIVQGDAHDSRLIEETLRKHEIEVIINTAGTREPLLEEQTLPKIVKSITSAAITVGKERGEPLRAWFIGGMGSLQYPGTRYQIQDYMPALLSSHMKPIELLLKSTSLEDLHWSLLCVAFMVPESEKIDLLDKPIEHNLIVQTDIPPGWNDHWTRKLPLIGSYINLVPVIASYTTKLEHVAELLAADVEKEKSEYLGKLVGFKKKSAENQNILTVEFTTSHDQ